MIISSAALVLCLLCCSSLDFFVLQTFSETIYASWSQKEEISRLVLSTSTSVLDSTSRCGSFGIAFVPQQFRATSTCILTFSYIGGTYVLDSSCLIILLSFKQCDPQLLRSGEKDLARHWTCWFHQIFASLAFSETKIGSFLAGVRPVIKKIWRGRKLNLRWNNQIENGLRAQIKYHTAIRVTYDNWRWILIRAVNAPSEV